MVSYSKAETTWKRGLDGFFCYGTNHKYAPQVFREGLYLSPEVLANVLPQIREHHQLPEIAVLSTCNRFEIYGIHHSPPAENALKLFSVFQDMQIFAKKSLDMELCHLNPQIFCFTGQRAVQHAFDVAASVDSLVIGETQITGQFKDAFSIAQRAQTLGPHLHHLSQNALHVAKKVRTQTIIGQKTVSIGHAAIDLARTIFSNLSEKRLLLLGAGEMAQVTGLYAKKIGIRDISIVNRTLSRAHELSHLLGYGRTGTLSELDNFLEEADIVITALTTQTPIVTASKLKSLLSRRKNRPMYIVDIALPRNVEKSCGEFEDVYLFELDDLRHYVDKNLSERQTAAKEAQKIIELSLESFCRRVNDQPESMVIANYHRYVERMIQRERQRSFRHKELQGLSKEQFQAVDVMLNSISQKLTAHFAIALKGVSDERKEHFKQLVDEIVKAHS